MSHVVSIATELRDLKAVEAACQRLGWSLQEGQTTYKWFGRWVDDSPVPEQLFTPDEAEKVKAMDRASRQKVMNGILGHCEHAIHVPGCDYEIGLLINPRTGHLIPVSATVDRHAFLCPDARRGMRA